MARPPFAALARLAWRHPRYSVHLAGKKIRFACRYRWALRHPHKDDRVPPPLVYKLELTYKCNLRCQMCFQWGHTGWCHEADARSVSQELAWPAVCRLVEAAAPGHPEFLLIGGEPMLYSRYRDLVTLLRSKKCFSITCTNGMEMHRFVDIIEGNPYHTLLVSLDGLREENDAIRGAGVYDQVIRNVKLVRSLRDAPYLGIQCTIRPENVHRLYDFCWEMVRLGVDWILINPSWHLSPAQEEAYRQFLQNRFRTTAISTARWRLPLDLDARCLQDQMTQIRRAGFPIQISCYLDSPATLAKFLDPSPSPPEGPCPKQWIRADILPDGSMTPCILYPDLKTGSLEDGTLESVWNSDALARFRTVRRDAALPVCHQCDAYYLYDQVRRYL